MKTLRFTSVRCANFFPVPAFLVVSCAASVTLRWGSLIARADEKKAPTAKLDAPRVAKPPQTQLSGITLAVQLLPAEDDGPIHTGEPLFVTVTIHNGSTKPLSLGGSAFDVSSFGFAMQDEKGQPVATTQYGKQALESPSVVFGNASMQISAGGSRRYRFPLERMFDLSESGSYIITVKRTIITAYEKTGDNIYKAETAELVSNPVTVRIVDSPEPQVNAPASPNELAEKPSRQYVYVATTYGRGDKTGGISRYLIGAGGRLSPLLQSWTDAGKGSRSIAVSPDNRFVYVANGGDDTLSQFRVTNNGGLEPLAPPAVPTCKYPVVVRISPDGKYAYALGSYGVAGYRVNANGTLTGMPATTPLPVQADEFVFHPSGRFAYGVNGYSVWQFRVRPDGGIESLSPEALRGGAAAGSIVTTPDGQYAYVATFRDLPHEAGKADRWVDVILTFKINPDGTLTLLDREARPQADEKSKASEPVYFGIRKLVIDPSGRYLYGFSSTKNLTAGFEIGAEGVLTPVGAPVYNPSASPMAMAFDSTRRFAYVANEFGGTLSQMRVGNRGVLETLGIDAYSNGAGNEEIAVVTAPTANPAGPVADGLQLLARLEQEVYNPGNPIVLTVLLKNTTAKSITLSTQADEKASFSITIKDARGASIPLLRYGQRLFKSGAASTRISQAQAVTLPGGAQRRYRFFLNRTHDITRYGTYELQVQRHGTDSTLLSNTVRWQLDNRFDKLSGDYLEKLPGGYRYYDGIGLPNGR